MMIVKIYDMDGTLVCSQHRYRLNHKQKIDLQHWINNEHLHVNDDLLPLVDEYKADLLRADVFVIIATARDLTSHNQHEWIDKKLGSPDAIVSRLGRDDRRGGVELKTQGILDVLKAANLTNAKKYFFEDNIDYLLGVCENIDAIPRYIPSNQGY